jgi:hypothetical protein
MIRTPILLNLRRLPLRLLSLLLPLRHICLFEELLRRLAARLITQGILYTCSWCILQTRVCRCGRRPRSAFRRGRGGPSTEDGTLEVGDAWHGLDEVMCVNGVVLMVEVVTHDMRFGKGGMEESN